MPSRYSHTLTNGTLVHYSPDTFIHNDTPASFGPSDFFACPSCPGQHTHMYGFASGQAPSSQDSQELVPATLVFASAANSVRPGNVGLVLAAATLDGPSLIDTIEKQLRYTYTEDQDQCSAQRMAFGLREYLIENGVQASMVNDPARIDFTGPSGVAYSFYPKRHESQWDRQMSRDGVSGPVSLSGRLRYPDPTRPAQKIGLDGALTVLDQYTPDGRLSTLLTFHLDGARADEPTISIPQ